MTIKAAPKGYHTVTPYLIVSGAAKAIDFYCAALGAVERMRLAAPDGKVGHAELQIGDSVVMLADEFPQMGALSPKSIGGSPVGLAMYVDDVDARFERAISAGAKVVRPVQDQFYGDRSGTFEDPFGHKWTLATHIEDVPPEEITRRFAEASKQAGQNE